MKSIVTRVFGIVAMACLLACGAAYGQSVGDGASDSLDAFAEEVRIDVALQGRDDPAQRKLPPRDQWPPAPVARTGQTRVYAPGDDGYHQAGVPWPQPRLTDNGDGTVTDHLTGLVWLKSASGRLGAPHWDEAIELCNQLAPGFDRAPELDDGSTPGDWRLPNLREIASLFDYSQARPALPEDHPFRGVKLASHWASTSHPIKLQAGFRYATQTGAVGGFSGKSSGRDPVWPVRGPVDGARPANQAIGDDGGFGPPAPVLRTGQEQSLHEGDDGFHQAGLPLTLDDAPRFTDNKDGTFTDRLTGLVWLAAGSEGIEAQTWEQAIALCNKLNTGQHGLADGSEAGDWRLPNVRELHSLMDFSQHDPALPRVAPFIPMSPAPSDLHWTSTTQPDNAEQAFSVHLMEGRIWVKHKHDRQYVWPVRGGL